MKPSVFLASTAALIAVAGCNSNQGNAATNAPVKYEQVKPPKGGTWADVINATPDGGVMMGNPNAKVHLIEYGSLTCPHCREFDEKGSGPLIDKYVKTGQVSYEFRNYIRDPLDLAAVLIAHCNGPKGFFPLARAFYKDQPNWIAKAQKAPEEQLRAMQNLPENQIAVESAKLADLQNWAAMRGVPQAKSTKCLSDTAAIDRAVSVSGAATEKYPDFPGTPTFIINGEMADKTATWEDLEPKLKAALGG